MNMCSMISSMINRYVLQAENILITFSTKSFWCIRMIGAKWFIYFSLVYVFEGTFWLYICMYINFMMEKILYTRAINSIVVHARVFRSNNECTPWGITQISSRRCLNHYILLTHWIRATAPWLKTKNRCPIKEANRISLIYLRHHSRFNR
jgi:hypothetical protein